MLVQISMPQLGESVTEGVLSKWLVKPGDRVKIYDPLCEVITDKVNAEVPSTVEGIIKELIAKEDETIPVGGSLCTIDSIDPKKEDGPKEGTVQSVEQEKKEPADQGAAAAFQEEKRRYSPAVLKLAQEHQIPLSEIKGTGFEGRVTRKDVLHYINKKEELEKTAIGNEKRDPAFLMEIPSSTPSPALSSAQSPPPLIPSSGDVERIPVTPVRRRIAEHMVLSKQEAPHAWMMVEVDATNLVKLRNRIKEDFRRREGISLTYLPFFIKAVVDALKEYPILNSQWTNEAIIMKKEINISIAVATDNALFVPVIKRADEKSILGLARSVDELAKKTKEGRLSPDDISGGTFTVNNTGSFGSVLSMPIINTPQAAILSVEAIVKRPVVIGEMIAIRDMVNLTLSLDHRILDGLVCGRFMNRVKEKIESIAPEMDLL